MSLLPKSAKEKADPVRYAISGFIEEAAAVIPEGSVVLDAGAGSCRYKPYFRRHRYIATDFCMVEDLNYKRMDVITDLSHVALKDDSVDAVICIEVLEHMREPLELVRELRRVIKPGGRLFLTCPQTIGIHMPPYDYYRFTSFALEDIFARAGMEVEFIRPKGGYFSNLAKLLSRLPNIFAEPEGGAFNKALYRVRQTVLKEVFKYWLPYMLVHLDFLDKKKYFTHGYLCRCIKPLD